MKATELVPVSDVAFGRERFATAHALHGQGGVALWESPSPAHTQPAAWLPLPALLSGSGRIGLSPDGSQLVASAATGELLLLRGGATLAEWKGPSAGVTAIAWSRDGKWIAAAGQDAAAPPPGAATHPDKAVSYGTAGRVYLFEAGAPRAAPKVLVGPPAAIVAVAFAEGKVIGLYKEGALAVWSLPDGKLGKTVELGGRGHAVAASADGRQIAAALATEAGEARVELLDGATLARAARLEGAPKVPVHLAYAPDGARLAVTGFSAVQVWDVKAGKRVAALEAPGGPRGAAFFPGGLVVVGGDGALWRLYGADLKAAAATAGPPRSAAPQ